MPAISRNTSAYDSFFGGGANRAVDYTRAGLPTGSGVDFSAILQNPFDEQAIRSEAIANLNSRYGLGAGGWAQWTPGQLDAEIARVRSTRTSNYNNALGQIADPKAPTPGETTRDVLEAFSQYLPQFFQSLNANIPAEEKARLQALLETVPQKAALDYNIFSNYGPQYQNVENQISNIKKTGEAASDLALVQGVGGDLARAQLELDKSINPEFYQQRAGLNKATLDVLSGLDPNKLSGSEEAQIERANNIYNQGTGNIGNTSATSVVGNALNFGNALMNKKAQIANIVNGFTGNVGQFRNNIGPYGSSQNNNSSSTQFRANSTNNNDTYSSGSNFLSGITSTAQQANQINADRRDPLDRLFQIVSLQNAYN